MKKITRFNILNVRMQGFKKFCEPYEAELDDVTYITGSNGQGKSTIADAIAFAFCGTPFWGEKSCDRLQNPECKSMRVDVRFRDGDGEIHTLTRERSDNATVIMYDTVSIKQSELNGMFAEKDVFLSLLNPLFFIEKIGEDGREFLQKLLPPVSDETVLSALTENTRSILAGESISDPEFYIKKKRAEVRDIDGDCSYLEGQLDLLRIQRKEAEEKLDKILAEGDVIVKRKTALEQKQFQDIDVDALQRQLAASGSGKLEELKAKLDAVRARKYESKFTPDLEKIRAEISALSEKYNKIMARGKSMKVGDVCPTCHTALSEESLAAILSMLRTELKKISELGNGAKSAYAELLEIDKQSEKQFYEFQTDDIKKLEAELKGFEASCEIPSDELERILRLGNLTEEEYTELCELRNRADSYAKEVESLADCEALLGKISKLEADISANTERKKKVQDQVYAAGEYAAKKAELTLETLKMNRAAIKLMEVVKTTGEVRNVFKFTYDGKDYRWLSTSERIKAGLEVSKLLSTLTGLSYPTYIDNAECITARFDPVPGQALLAYVRNCPLTLHYPARTPAAVREAA